MNCIFPDFYSTCWVTFTVMQEIEFSTTDLEVSIHGRCNCRFSSWSMTITLHTTALLQELLLSSDLLLEHQGPESPMQMMAARIPNNRLMLRWCGSVLAYEITEYFRLKPRNLTKYADSAPLSCACFSAITFDFIQFSYHMSLVFGIHIDKWGLLPASMR